jgi:hypothetical protein
MKFSNTTHPSYSANTPFSSLANVVKFSNTDFIYGFFDHGLINVSTRVGPHAV